jgi:hypothetical protein
VTKDDAEAVEAVVHVLDVEGVSTVLNALKAYTQKPQYEAMALKIAQAVDAVRKEQRERILPSIY